MSFDLISVVPLSDGIFDAAALQFEIASVGGGKIVDRDAGGLRLQSHAFEFAFAVVAMLERIFGAGACALEVESELFDIGPSGKGG